MSLFKSRRKKAFGEKCREFLWPSQGLGRTFNYWRHRMTRLPGTPQSIASGVAAGAAMSFMPPGLHMVMAAGLALITRGNVIAATLVSVAFGNPVMTALLLSLDIGLGELLMGARHREVTGEVSLIEFFQHPIDTLARFGLPFALGAILLAVVAWIVTYFVTLRFIEFAHARRAKRLRKKWQRRQGAADKVAVEGAGL
jgi:uncharacterized protein